MPFSSIKAKHPVVNISISILIKHSLSTYIYWPLIKDEEPSLPYYLPITEGRTIGFIPFPRVLVLSIYLSISLRQSIHIYLYHNVHLSLSVCLSLYQFVHIYLIPFVSVIESVHIYQYHCAHLSLFLSLTLSLSFSLSLYIYIYQFLYKYLSIYVCMFLCFLLPLSND